MTLRSVQNTYIIACTEDISPLEKALIKEGFSPEISRMEYSSAEQEYSGAVRCMLNHANVWKQVAAGTGLSLVVEADFIPVRRFGDLPLPFPPSRYNGALGYLYAGGATLFDVQLEEGRIYGRGHASCTVAYVIGPEAARCLLEFADHEMKTQDLTRHNLWDCRIRMFLQERGITSWLPYRQYGEHGGIPNPEHAQAGYNPSHQADVLFAPLSALPLYANGSRRRLAVVRAKARMRGVVRLLLGRYLTHIDVRRAVANGTWIPLLRFAFGRQLGLQSAMR